MIPFRDGSRVKVGEGERITSLRQIAEGVGYYENGVWKVPHVETIRRILQWLEGEQMISLGRDRRYTHLKVLNWGVYQGEGAGECDSEWTDNGQTTNTNNKEKKEKKEKKVKDRENPRAEKTKVPYQKIVDMYHDLCPSFPRVIKLNSSRRSQLKARYEDYGLDGLEILFKKAEASDFLKGRNERRWKAKFDWFINSSNSIKVLEGNYDDIPFAGHAAQEDDLDRHLRELGMVGPTEEGFVGDVIDVDFTDVEGDK